MLSAALPAAAWSALVAATEASPEGLWSLNGLVVLAGIVVCAVAGLLSLVPSPERPLVFVPVYLVGMALFVAGLALIFWHEPAAGFVSRHWSF